MGFSTITEWLDWISSVHYAEIELGLPRVKAVAKRLGVLSFNCPVIIVGGTNGKGSTVAGLAAIYQAAGYQVGSFTSPILFRHNEQVKINEQESTDDDFCQAFTQIEAHRGDISLTPFEYHTLAALSILQSHELDVIILEVGLGGRLDAVNIIDADVSVITSIALDHMEWLGQTREAIGAEKAGIFRSLTPAVCGDDKPPQSLVAAATQCHSPLFIQGQQFYYKKNNQDWSFICDSVQYHHLPLTTLALQNMATVLMTVVLLQSRLTVSLQDIKKGLASIQLIGRVQVIKGSVAHIFDVSHNPASVAYLALRLKEMAIKGRILAVFSMLGDKDILQSIQGIQQQIDVWHVAALPQPRAAVLTILQQVFSQAKILNVNYFSSLEQAYQAAKTTAQPSDCIVVFGSFHTVAIIGQLIGLASH